ncbi:MAG: FeoA family protein [Phycisphaerales bacterium]
MGHHSSKHPQPDSSGPVRIPLTQLRRGQRAIVDCSELTQLPEGDRCLLHAMGLHHQCTVEVCRSGAPCIVQIDTTRLGLSGSVASKIMVTPLPDEPAARP